MCILRGFLKTRIFVFSIVRRRHLHEMGRIAGFDCGNDAPWDLRRNLDSELSLVPRSLETRTKRGFPHSHSDYGDGTRLSGKTNPAKIAGPVGFLNRTYFLFKALICCTRVPISSEVSLSAYFGMRSLPLVMMLCRSSADIPAVFSERRDGPPKWRPVAALP